MAVSDADGLFTTIDVGELGRNSDGGVFKSSQIGKMLNNGKVSLPPPSKLPGSENIVLPHYLVGDEAFPLLPYLMWPYPQKLLNNKWRIYNYRHSRGRKSVEYSFGMLTSKFQIIEHPICCKEDRVINIVKSACALSVNP